MPNTQYLVVMLKAPLAGRVKTRLARGIGPVMATAFYRHTTAAVLARVMNSREWTTILAVAPDSEAGTRMLPQGARRRPQGHGNLGQRMQRITNELPPGPVVMIGSDIPGITARHIRQAFAALGGNDAVFGPAPDGGFWLVGLKRFPRIPQAFANVRWSTEHALADTRANLAERSVALLELLDDIDEAPDLMRTTGAHGRRIPASI